jgi:hypothetical protein
MRRTPPIASAGVNTGVSGSGMTSVDEDSVAFVVVLKETKVGDDCDVDIVDDSAFDVEVMKVDALEPSSWIETTDVDEDMMLETVLVTVVVFCSEEEAASRTILSTSTSSLTLRSSWARTEPATSATRAL